MDLVQEPAAVTSAATEPAEGAAEAGASAATSPTAAAAEPAVEDRTQVPIAAEEMAQGAVPSEATSAPASATAAASASAAAGAGAPAAAPAWEDDIETQVRIDNLHKWSTLKQVREMLLKLGVTGMRKVKKQQHESYGFVYFNTVAERYTAEPLIQGNVWKKQSLTVATALPLDRDRFIKRQAEGDEARDAKRARQGDAGGSSAGGADGEGEGGGVGVGGAHTPRTAADAVAPLHNVLYASQLVRKQQAMLKELKKLPQEMHRAAKGAQPDQRADWKALTWLEEPDLRANGFAPCPLAEVARSPLELGYRNKCEFSFGRDADGAPCVGFVLGQVRLQEAVVALYLSTLYSYI